MIIFLNQIKSGQSKVVLKVISPIINEGFSLTLAIISDLYIYTNVKIFFIMLSLKYFKIRTFDFN